MTPHRWSHSRGLIRCTRCGVSARDEHGRRIIHIEDVPDSHCAGEVVEQERADHYLYTGTRPCTLTRPR